jgi:hypothetical protein
MGRRNKVAVAVEVVVVVHQLAHLSISSPLRSVSRDRHSLFLSCMQGYRHGRFP